MVRTGHLTSTDVSATVDVLLVEDAECKMLALEQQRQRVLVTGNEAGIRAIDGRIKSANCAVERIHSLRERLEAIQASVEKDGAFE